jgi:hypothetical protein
VSNPADETAKKRAVNNYIDAEQLKKDSTFSNADIDGAMTEQSGLLAYWAVQAAHAAKQEGVLKLKREVMEAKVAKQMRDEAAESGKKITETQISKDLILDPRVMQAHLNYNEAKVQAQLGRDALEAMKHRRDMLVQRGVSEREERKGATRVRSEEAETDRREMASADRRARALEIASQSSAG